MAGFYQNQNLCGVGSFPAPYITELSPSKLNHSTTTDVVFSGSYFTPDTTVSIPGLVVNSVTFINDNTIIVNVTSGNVDNFYDVAVNNGQVSNLPNALEVALSSWIDLRAGGDVFTDGNAAGNDIRYRAGMTMSRDADGMFFSGANPWSSWVKFESLGWSRGANITLEWVFSNPDSTMMIGVGSDATAETATTQFLQAETLAYFNGAVNFWGLYGNNGTPGSTGNQGSSAVIPANSFFKAKFENDGGTGGQFTLYELPDSVSWDDESTTLETFVIGGTLNPDEANIMPFIIPRAGGTQRFPAVRVS